VTSIAIAGAGHVGVVYAAGLAELGHTVRVIDTDPERIAKLRRGEIWFYEPGLPELLDRGLSRGRIAFTTSYAVGLGGAKFVFVCVPTPSGADGSLDDSYIRAAFSAIREHSGHPRPIVVNKSTVPVGTGDLAKQVFEDPKFRIISNPEFLSEGRAIEDFFHPTRVVIGAHDREAAESAAALYAPLRAPVVYTDPVTAEFSKLAANAFLATKVSFANALSQISEAIGANGDALAQALSLDPRIGAGHLRPGLGFGGSCLPKDLAAMESLARRFSVSAELFRAVDAVNRAQRVRVVDFLLERFGALDTRRLAVLGITFKANTDDMRDSPALALAQQLAALSADVRVYDPVAGWRPTPNVAGSNLRVVANAYAAARGADALIVGTEWPEFAALDLQVLKRAMRGSLVVDCRGILDARQVMAEHFEFFSFSTRRRDDQPRLPTDRGLRGRPPARGRTEGPSPVTLPARGQAATTAFSTDGPESLDAGMRQRLPVAP